MAEILEQIASEIKMLTVKDLAERLQISRRHLYRLLDQGNLPTPVRLGASLRWDAQKVKAWIDAGCPSA